MAAGNEQVGNEQVGNEQAGNEQAGNGGDVERYEQLRAHALGGEPGGWRLGLGLLQGRGTAAWLRVCRGVTAAPAPQRHCLPPELPRGDELVSVLATMALACAGS